MMLRIKDEKKPFHPLPLTVSSPLLLELVKTLLDKNAETRPDARSLLENPEIKLNAERIAKELIQADTEMGLII
jgi:hypothetical protein